MINRRSIVFCIAFILFCEAVGGAGSFFTAQQIPGWYTALHKPGFNPPNWIFGPVWTLLYALIGIAGWRLWREDPSPARNTAVALWAIQLFLNAIWTPVFFGAHAMLVALVIIIVLDLAVIALIRAAYKVCSTAGALLIPYLCWILFATALNEELWRLNQ